MRADRRSDWGRKTFCFLLSSNWICFCLEKRNSLERGNFCRWSEREREGGVNLFFFSRWSSAEQSCSSTRIDWDDKQISSSKWLSCVDDQSPSPRYHFDSTTSTKAKTEGGKEKREFFSLLVVVRSYLKLVNIIGEQVHQGKRRKEKRHDSPLSRSVRLDQFSICLIAFLSVERKWLKSSDRSDIDIWQRTSDWLERISSSSSSSTNKSIIFLPRRLSSLTNNGRWFGLFVQPRQPTRANETVPVDDTSLIYSSRRSTIEGFAVEAEGESSISSICHW